jgi:hypothetical protein
MPSISRIVLTLLSISYVLAAPLPQLAGEGAAANSILSDTDNGVGYGIENAEDNIAGNVATVKVLSQLFVVSSPAKALLPTAFSPTQTTVWVMEAKTRRIKSPIISPL